MNKFDLCFVFLVNLLFIVIYLKEKKKTIRAEIRLLQARLDLARERRRTWKSENFDFQYFDNPEYQMLWDVEIGCESLLLLLLEKNGQRGQCLSWWKYVQERKEFQKKSF